MKKVYLVYLLISILGAAAFFLVSYNVDTNKPSIYPYENPDLNANLKKPEYHFAMICQTIDDPFWKAVTNGALEASGEFKVAVEFYGPSFFNAEEELRYLEMATASKVDGIVTHVPDEALFAQAIDKASLSGIPVVTIDSDAKNSKRVSFIGKNSYKLGTEWGKLVIEATGGKAFVAMIVDDYKEGTNNTAQNLAISGLKDSVKNYPDIKLKTFQSNKLGNFRAEEVTNEILTQYANVDLILCTNGRDTIGTAQVLIDFNKVGDIAIIGYDDTAEILRYIQKGVIYGTVASNPGKMGYESIKALFGIKKTNGASSYISTDVHTITAKNLENYQPNLYEKQE